MKRILLTVALVLAGVGGMYARPALNQQKNPEWIVRGIKVVEAHAGNMLPRVLEQRKLPRSEERGLRNISDWTSGFYPGILWYLYEYTQDNYWKENADAVTRILEKEQYNTEDHDIGFRIGCSYGKGYELTGNKEYASVVVQAAKSLSTRFIEKAQTIQSWSAMPERDWKCPVIIDNMMNLELMYDATALSGDEKFADISYRHACTTMKNHFRKDYSCPHVVDYDPVTGKKRRDDYNNGFSDPGIAAWSRGQGWALYGYTLMYRYTKDKKFLNHAEHVAEFILNHPNLPEDMIPYWDFSSPKIPTKRDASAGALYASALLELSTYSKDNSEKYFKAAEKILKSLSSDAYLAKPGTNGDFAIKHATGNFLRGSELDNTLIYADYYYIEALMRYLKLMHHQPLYKLF